MSNLSKFDNGITLKEIATPIALPDYGKVYTKTDNKLYFQDGAGVEHEITVATSDYAEMYAYESSVATTVNVTGQYHSVQGIYTAGQLNKWAFTAGSSGSGTITTAEAGAAININNALHGLVSDDIINVQSANHTGTKVVTKIDDNNFTVPIAYVGDETGYWQKGDYLEAGVGSAGTYRFSYNMSLTSAGNGKTYKFELCKNTTHIDESAAERKIGTGADIGAMGAGGLLTIAEGDIIFLMSKNIADITNFTLKHSNLTLNRI